MRISTSQLYNSGVTAMQRAQSQLNHTSLQLSTGRRILTPADDPGGAAQASRLQSSIDAIGQYQRNANAAQARLDLEESQLGAYDTQLQRVREIVVAAGNDTYQYSDRLTFASEIRQIRDDILSLANNQDANGEYLFAGTRSLDEPFETDADGHVIYVGATGSDAVREIALSKTRSIRLGDTGDAIFMNIPEASGQLLEAVSSSASLLVDSTKISDKDVFELNAEDTFEIRFGDDGAGNILYEVVDASGNPINDENGDPIQDRVYQPGSPIEFAGRQVVLSGTAADGDVVTSQPTAHVSIFETLDAIATALEIPVTDDTMSDALNDATSIALLNIDSSLDRMNEVRTSVGLRLQAVDAQADSNTQRKIALESTLSDVQDLDFAEAISRYKLQEVVLQAAQQTYVQVSRMSLFDFL